MVPHIAFVLLLIANSASGFAQSLPNGNSTVSAALPAPDDRARQWLVLVDDKNYAQSWAEASTLFQGKQNIKTWADREAALREPLGAIASRDLKSINLGRANVAVLRYDTVFAHKAQSIETVTLTFEHGSWRVTDYTVQ